MTEHLGCPDEIELCGNCGNRIYRLGPEAKLYCYGCGHGEKLPPVAYRRTLDQIPVRIVPENAPPSTPFDQRSSGGVLPGDEF